jgi:hypothetical protein|tara:strand:+ start:1959 stop:2330 length:372 start_codon:yes stop_codon:yes gene_type:complete
MQTATSTPSKKRAPIATTKVAAKPLSKAKVTAVPRPTKAGKGSARTVYKFTGKQPEGKTPQMNALITTVNECKKTELDSASFTAQDLVSLAVKKGTLTTGQDPLRIFRFYAKRLVDEGYFAKA